MGGHRIYFRYRPLLQNTDNACSTGISHIFLLFPFPSVVHGLPDVYPGSPRGHMKHKLTPAFVADLPVPSKDRTFYWEGSFGLSGHRQRP